jgi:hypothetical protein
MKLRLVLILCATLATLAAAPSVHSDTMLSAHGGVAFGGDVGDTPATWGGALTFMGDGLLGFEIEGAYTPDFFGDEEDLGFTFDDNNVSTLMGHLLLGGGNERGRLFVSVGGGIQQTRANDIDEFFDIDSTDFAASAGVGGMAFFSNNFGVRGDVRYFRSFGEDVGDDDFDLDFGDFSYWRGTAGLVFKF